MTNRGYHSAWPTIVFFAGTGLTLLVLATGLPLRAASPAGELATMLLYALNPPVILVNLAVESAAQDIDMTVWHEVQYPVFVVVGVVWWFLLRQAVSAIVRHRHMGRND